MGSVIIRQRESRRSSPGPPHSVPLCGITEDGKADSALETPGATALKADGNNFRIREIVIDQMLVGDEDEDEYGSEEPDIKVCPSSYSIMAF